MKNLKPYIMSLCLGLPSLILSQEAQESYVVTEEKHDVYFENSGHIEAIKRAKISAQTTGIVKYLGANVAESFKKGAVLVKLSSVYQQAKVKEAKHQLSDAKLNLAERQRQYRRVQQLYDRNLAKEQDLTAKRTAFEQAKQAINQKKEKLKQLKEIASYTTIRAPFSGVVEKRHIHRAEKISVAQTLYSIYNPNKLRAVVTVPESMLKKIKKYQKVWVKNQEQSFLIDFKNVVIFPSSYNYAYTLRVTLPKKISSHFHDGNFVNVKFKIDTENAIYLDNKYLYKRHETNIVYVQNHKKHIAQYVRLGESANNKTKILSGLVTGDKVVQREE